MNVTSKLAVRKCREGARGCINLRLRRAGATSPQPPTNVTEAAQWTPEESAPE